MKNIFEQIMWQSRNFVILAVIFGLISAIILFVIASIDVFGVIVYVAKTYLNQLHPPHFHEEVIGGIIGAVDLYLIAVVMLIFSFGLYELFISKITSADKSGAGENILIITSLDQLKNKIGKVIIMVLIVQFFQKIGSIAFQTPLQMVYFAISVAFLAISLFLISKVSKH